MTNIEAVGGGTLAYDEATDTVQPHIHLSLGLKAHSATAHTSHLNATVQFLAELVIVEITHPPMHSTRQAELYNVPLLHFDDQQTN